VVTIVRGVPLLRIRQSDVEALREAICVGIEEYEPKQFAAWIIWTIRGEVFDDPYVIDPRMALDRANFLAESLKRNVVYVAFMPEQSDWPDVWGPVTDVRPLHQ
jgi:hypothetical protein